MSGQHETGLNPARLYVQTGYVFQDARSSESVLAELRAKFGLWGQVRELFFVKGKTFCFVEMQTIRDADAARAGAAAGLIIGGKRAIVGRKRG